MLGAAAGAAGATGAARGASRLGARGGPGSKPYGASDGAGGAAAARNPFLQSSLPEGAPQPYHITQLLQLPHMNLPVAFWNWHFRT